MRIFCLAVLIALAVAGCDRTTVPKQDLPSVAQKEALAAAAGAALPEIEFTTLTRDLTKPIYGRIEGNADCLSAIDLPLSWVSALTDSFFRYRFTALFVETLRDSGYRATALEHDTQRPVQPRIQVAARFVDFLFNFCAVGEVITFRSLGLYSKGEAFMKIDWTIFDVQQDRVVARLVTEGTGRQSELIQNGNEAILAEAFQGAVKNLLADPKVRAIFSGAAP